MARNESAVELPSFNRMESEAERLNDLIEQTRILSRIENMGELTNLKRFSVGLILEEMLPNMEFEAAARECSVTIRDGASTSFITGHRSLIRRALANVIRNVIRFAPPATAVEIYISELSHKEAAGNPSLIVRVGDPGPGVPADSLCRQAKAHCRTDSVRRDAAEGLGIEPSVANRIVQLHQGTMTIVNRPHGGLSVLICIPFDLNIGGPTQMRRDEVRQQTSKHPGEQV